MLLQVVNLYQQCDPSAWASAATSPWQVMKPLLERDDSGQNLAAPLLQGLLEVVLMTQRLQVQCPENQVHSSSWSGAHLTPISGLLTHVQNDAVRELCEGIIYNSLVSLGLHSGSNHLVCPSYIVLSRSVQVNSFLFRRLEKINACHTHDILCANVF